MKICIRIFLKVYMLMIIITLEFQIPNVMGKRPENIQGV